MNYELKSIQPGSVFMSAVRIFVVVGFIVAILSFFVLPNPNIRTGAALMDIAARVAAH